MIFLEQAGATHRDRKVSDNGLGWTQRPAVTIVSGIPEWAADAGVLRTLLGLLREHAGGTLTTHSSEG